MNRSLQVLLLFLGWPVSTVLAQTDPLYIQFSPRTVKGAFYKPDAPLPRPTVAILAMHRTSNVMGGLACEEMAARGFAVLCMNPRFDNNEAKVHWEEIALDVRSGVEFLRKQPGIGSVVLWGHSGGGATMSFYQAVSEQGPAYCQGRNKLVPCGDNLTGLPPADAIVFVDAHPGNPVNGLRSLNPAVVDENHPEYLDPALDPFSPKNGYNPNGPSNYSETFKKKYFEGQALRMGRLIDRAQRLRRQIRSGKYAYPDDDVFLVPRGVGGRLMQMDPSIHASSAKPRKLLKNDGSVVTQVVTSVRKARPDLVQQNASFSGGTRSLTIRSFLSANATRATDSMDGIDWCSSNNSSNCAVQQISVPILIVAMGAHYFIRDNEIVFDLAASQDKDFVVIEGATHGMLPCLPCQSKPGQYSNSATNFFDYVRDWINSRF